MNNLTWLKKIKDLGHGRTGAMIKGFIFVNFSIFFGLWLGIKFFLPDDFILSKINERLFEKDMGLIAQDVDISIFGNVSIYEGSLTEKGEKVTSFYQLELSPSILDLVFGEFSGTIYLDDINNQGGDLEIGFETNETPCYYAEVDEVPLSVLKVFLSDISLVGTISGEAEVCLSEKKTYSGSVELYGKDVVFRGKVPTKMGPLNLGKIEIGSIDLISDIKNSVMTIEQFITSGLFDIDVAGKVTLNSGKLHSTRVNLDVRIKAPDAKKLEKTPTLNLAIGQMSKYKKGKDKYAFLVKGLIGSPRMLNAPNKRAVKKGKANKKIKSKKKVRKDRKKPKKRKSRKKPKKRPAKAKKAAKPAKKDKKLPPRKEKTESDTTQKLEDDVDEEKKKEKVEKEEVENEEDEEDEAEEEEEKEVEKKKSKELPDARKKKEKSGEEDEEDEEDEEE